MTIKQAYGRPDTVNMLNKTLVSLSDVWVIRVAGSGPTGLLLTFHIAQRTGSNPQADGKRRGEMEELETISFLYFIYLFCCWRTH